LISGLYTQENLKYARTIADVSNNNYYTNIIEPLSSSVPFYKQYVIDPNGSLFGKTPCGVNNYLHFIQIRGINDILNTVPVVSDTVTTSVVVD
jgi:hypothetical protein